MNNIRFGICIALIVCLGIIHGTLWHNNKDRIDELYKVQEAQAEILSMHSDDISGMLEGLLDVVERIKLDEIKRSY